MRRERKKRSRGSREQRVREEEEQVEDGKKYEDNERSVRCCSPVGAENLYGDDQIMRTHTHTQRQRGRGRLLLMTRGRWKARHEFLFFFFSQTWLGGVGGIWSGGCKVEKQTTAAEC